MKRCRFLIVTSICVATILGLSAFNKKEIRHIYSENCGQWSKVAGISMRQCTDGYKHDDGERYNHQFFNGYNFKVHFYVVLTYTDGTESCSADGCWINLYLDGGETSDQAENGGVGRKSIQSWRVTKKQRQDSNGKWVDF